MNLQIIKYCKKFRQMICFWLRLSLQTLLLSFCFDLMLKSFIREREIFRIKQNFFKRWLFLSQRLVLEKTVLQRQ